MKYLIQIIANQKELKERIGFIAYILRHLSKTLRKPVQVKPRFTEKIIHNFSLLHFIR